eukprot:TRINITY_DN3429_c0_g1_i3.p1 TRINITY_DN3429_c0_g1~~TRINITY_DN3429_c0_g1_i3.p1  ORF type:complete len:435 (-),score=17.82 TRINITY_DN3429_c0_g1_i3:170-1474(-)
MVTSSNAFNDYENLLENLDERFQDLVQVIPQEAPIIELVSGNFEAPIAEIVINDLEGLVESMPSVGAPTAEIAQINDLEEQPSSDILNEYESVMLAKLNQDPSSNIILEPNTEIQDAPSIEASVFGNLEEILSIPASDFEALYAQKTVDNLTIVYVQKVLEPIPSVVVGVSESSIIEIQQGLSNEDNFIQDLDEQFESGQQNLSESPIVEIQQGLSNEDNFIQDLDEQFEIGQQFLPTLSIAPNYEGAIYPYNFENLEYGAVDSTVTQLNQRFLESGEPVNLLEADSICETTRARCSCLPQWSYDADKDGVLSLFRGCIQTADARGRAWCAVDGDSCRNSPASEYVEKSRYDGPWDFCPKTCTLTRRSNCTTTVSDCRCRIRWEYEGLRQKGCTKPDGTSSYSWCLVRKGCKTAAGYLSTNNAQWDICQDECYE